MIYDPATAGGVTPRFTTPPAYNTIPEIMIFPNIIIKKTVKVQIVSYSELKKLQTGTIPLPKK